MYFVCYYIINHIEIEEEFTRIQRSILFYKIWNSLGVRVHDQKKSQKQKTHQKLNDMLVHEEETCSLDKFYNA